MKDDIPNVSGVYRITCTVTSKFYIGSSVNMPSRRNSHFRKLRKNKHDNTHLQNAWNKYGEQAFTFEVIEFVLPMSLTAREQYWLNKLKPFGNKGFNIARDAEAPMLGRKFLPEHSSKIGRALTGQTRSEQTREKIRAARSRQTFSKETRQRLSEAGKKRFNTDEERRKLSEAHKANPRIQDHLKELNEAQKGRTPHNKGIPHTDAARKKMSEARKGKPHSEEHRRNIGEAQKGRTYSEETRKKMSESAIRRAAAKRETRRHDHDI